MSEPQVFRPRYRVASPGAPLVLGCAIPEALPAGDWLTAQEAGRAAAMRSARRRAEFVAGRWLLHRAARQAFEDGYAFEAVGGRPLLRAPQPASCSISHTTDLVLCAAGRVRACGVDVERIRARRDWEARCARVRHPRERARVREAAAGERWRRFYEIWVFKEAIAKALGIGLGFPFRALAVSAAGAIEDAPPGHGLREQDWRVCALDAGEGFAAAIAWHP